MPGEVEIEERMKPHFIAMFTVTSLVASVALGDIYLDPTTGSLTTLFLKPKLSFGESEKDTIPVFCAKLCSDNRRELCFVLCCTVFFCLYLRDLDLLSQT